MMTIYDQFASAYQRGPYLRFSQLLVESVLPDYLSEIGVTPSHLLDMACGEGSLAVGMAKLGYQVTGIDQSQRMIALAKERANKENLDVSFFVEDMRSLSYQEEFSLVTCFFDSLNYLLTIRDLQEAFKGAYRALRPGGFFIFDMNTIYGLAVDWMQQETYIQNEAQDFIEIHRQSYDYENQIATMAVTVFSQQGTSWERMDETHRERGYPIADIQFLLNEAGFVIAGMYGNLKNRTEVQRTSPRVWFTARKPG
ncbi:MAG: class I SAM-dependent methyltransferase [Chloroflexota bacterium]|nr:class I SAM-dependent methyltransferase [Chloroflexota bacterium]